MTNEKQKIIIADKEFIVSMAVERACGEIPNVEVECFNDSGSLENRFRSEGIEDVGAIIMDNPIYDKIILDEDFREELNSRGVPYILHNSDSASRGSKAISNEGAFGYIQKPSQTEDYVSVIERALVSRDV